MAHEKPAVSARDSVAYLATVLGIESFLAPTHSASSPAAAPPSHALPFRTEGPLDARLVFVAPATELQREMSELLAKMIAAMKLDPAGVLRVGLEASGISCGDLIPWIAAHPRAAVVVLGTESALRLSGEETWVTARWLEPQVGVPILVTHALSELVQKNNRSNELKRLVWQHLQMVMKRL